jgi:sn-glycerol 3-phosphate transport system substrate-binding protein
MARLRQSAIGAAGAFLLGIGTAAAAPLEIQWWHSMTDANAAALGKIAQGFNDSQADYKIVPVYKGSYPEALNAGIAAFRAGQAPAILQVFEVGTATMMAAKGAIKPVYQLMQEAGEPLDPDSYLPAIAGYYSSADGHLMSMPFNSSTPVMYYNKDAFAKAGLDPNAPPKTWPDFLAAAVKLKQAGSPCGFTIGWMSWSQLEAFGAWHNVPFATEANGLGGKDAVLTLNGPLQVRHIDDLVKAAADRSFDYAGRQSEPDAKFVSGECAMIQTSSGLYGTAKANAKFSFGIAPLPYYPDIAGAPQNSVIGGASLWVLQGRTPEEYKGVAKFFTYLNRPEIQVGWHEATGYLPITKAAYEAAKADGFYDRNPGIDTAIHELLDKPPTENSRGLRLGNLPQIRDAIAEEIEGALAGKESAQEALDKAKARGDAILRSFEKTTG